MAPDCLKLTDTIVLDRIKICFGVLFLRTLRVGSNFCILLTVRHIINHLLIIALARYGGLRCPSEFPGLNCCWGLSALTVWLLKKIPLMHWILP